MQLDCQRMEEKETQERLEGEQEGEELEEKEEHAQEGEEQEGEGQEGEGQEGEGQEGEEQEGEEQEGEPDQNQLKGLDSTPHSEELPEQIRFFDIHFNRSMKRYTIATLQKSVPPWYDLDSEPDFTLQDETFKRGDFVAVKLYDKNDSNYEDDIACIDDIKALPRPDQRKLLLISWIYLYDGRYYGSNHLQIVLWDTVAGRAAKKQVQEIRHDELYNACGGVKLCGKKQADVWHKRKEQILSSEIC
jgi:hypothetical protein